MAADLTLKKPKLPTPPTPATSDSDEDSDLCNIEEHTDTTHTRATQTFRSQNVDIHSNTPTKQPESSIKEITARKRRKKRSLVEFQDASHISSTVISDAGGSDSFSPIRPSKRQKLDHQNDVIYTWSCPRCQCENVWNVLFCGICSNPKPVEKPAEYPVDKSRSPLQNDQKENNDKSTPISALVSSLQHLKVNLTEKSKEISNSLDAMNSVDGLIGQLQDLEFDPAANSALDQNPEMSGLIGDLAQLDLSRSTSQERMERMLNSAKTGIAQFVNELKEQVAMFQSGNVVPRNQAQDQEPINRSMDLIKAMVVQRPF